MVAIFCSVSSSISTGIIRYCFRPNTSVKDIGASPRIPTPVESRAESGTDGGLALIDRPKFKPLDVLQEEVVIERQRSGDIGQGGKGNQADPIAGPLLNELLQNLLRHRQPVQAAASNLKILRCHAPGKVEG